MACRDFQTQMEQWLTGQLKDEAWKTHKDTCSECSQLYNEVMQPENIKVLPSDEFLTRKILAVTTNKPCEEIELKDHDLMTVFERKLQDYHIFNCANCRHLLEVNEQLKKDLPLLAEHRVPTDLTQALYRIFKVNKYSLPFIWRRLWRRPRFSLEFSYALAIFFWMIISLTPGNLWTQVQSFPTGQQSIQQIRTSSETKWNTAMKNFRFFWSAQHGTYQEILKTANEKSHDFHINASKLTQDLFQIQPSTPQANQSKETPDGKPNGKPNGKPKQ